MREARQYGSDMTGTAGPKTSGAEGTFVTTPGANPDRGDDRLTILGRTVRESRKLESFAKPDLVTEVTLDAVEGTSLCPVTGQPDFWTAAITYRPRYRCLETKSLKLFLQSFRTDGAFCEQLAAMIADEVYRALDPEVVHVEVHQSIRGGISITAKAERF